MTARLVVFGASGFLGQTLLRLGPFALPVIAVSREPSRGAGGESSAVTWQRGDLTVPSSIAGLLRADDIVLNLAYMPEAGELANYRMIDTLTEACLQARVGRLVHCSTAMVVGATKDRLVSEESVCVPVTVYERTKYLMEQRILDALSRGLDAVILRPTAIVGTGGKNLRSLARLIRSRSRATLYLRACLFGTRCMHLVPAVDVAAAVLHVAMLPGRLTGEVFHVSADDDQDNNYLAVEGILRDALGVPRRRTPVVAVPPAVLSFLLRIRGRSETDPRRVYLPNKLRGALLMPTKSVAAAVREFGVSLEGET